MIVRTAVLLVLVCCPCLCRSVEARTIYVDSRAGNDLFDGLSAAAMNVYTGPVRTLQRAAELLCPGDTLVLAAREQPYYGSLSLTGCRFSGLAGAPLRIEGNGAVVSGALPVRGDSWEQLAADWWRFTPVKKTHVQLIRDGVALPSFETPWSPPQLPEFPPGNWCVYRSQVYYRSRPEEDPRQQAFQLAVEDVGMTLLDVAHVIISDVTFRHFRRDGVHAHDRCEHVRLDRVICEQNGRAGVCVSGTARLEIRDSLLIDNARHSLLLTELAEAAVLDSELSRPPTDARQHTSAARVRP
jgi:hypothetical protein